MGEERVQKRGEGKEREGEGEMGKGRVEGR